METKRSALITIFILAVTAIAVVTIYQIKQAGERAGKQLVADVSKSGKPASAPSADATNTPTSAATSSPAQQKTATASKTTASKTPSPQNYTQAVAAYQGKRIQFDSECHASPSYLVFKSPVALMLDNRANVTRKITISGKIYSLAPYGYAIATVSSKTLPAEVGIACDKLYNTARISLQK